MKALALTSCLALSLPEMAQACHQLSENVWMCAHGTAWHTAEWDPYGDGATLLLDDYALSFTEDFPGADIKDDLSTLQEQFVTYSELVTADGTPPIEVYTQEVLEIATGQSFRSLQRDRYDDIETVSAVMLAEVRDARIMLYLDGPRTLDWASIDDVSRDVLALLRGECADKASCASPDRSLVVIE